MHRLVFLTALAVLLTARFGSHDRVYVVANHHKQASSSTHSHQHHAVPRIRAKRLQELLADQRAREAGSPRQQEQIARIRQQTVGTNRRRGDRGGQDYAY